MDADPSFLPPGSYGVVWPLLGGLLLLLLLVWAGVVWLMTRPPQDESHAPLPPSALVKLRGETLAQIDEVERSVREGERTARAGHHELSKVVRRFVAEVSGLDAEKMTARDLRKRGPEHLARLIAAYYPSQFGAAESAPPSIGKAASAAREVVGGWS
ncbi:hypothetical protein AWH69_02010 [Janibacter melonis]|uniref:DUF4381 family protein n=1 Tax=Janibacter melonis TaxID=262209 RepID=A0A176QFZ4_9MICO|nr:hypothetical protein [Janibacter melonis]OAB88600.1 hypothetical protein AWH69_02010 [Janibacter melonis]